tara:strand:- start:2043 stop:2624 length:582 start_codon:yes stop_codon:yes gene_type:complete
MFDLNGKEFKGTSIFNGGIAGKVDDVTISVEKKKDDEPDTYPAYKVVIEDNAGGKINSGFYYFTPNSSKSDEDNSKLERLQVGRVLHIARAVMGNDYSFPNVTTSKEAFDTLFKLVSDNAGGGKYNVFATYGTTSYPNKKGYLSLRYFNFIENAASPSGTLKAGPADLLEKIAPSEPVTTSSNTGAATSGGWS